MGVGKEKNIPGEEHGAHATDDERSEYINQWAHGLEEKSGRALNLEKLAQEMITNTRQYSQIIQARIEHAQELSLVLRGPSGYPEDTQVMKEEETEEDQEREEKEKSQKG